MPISDKDRIQHIIDACDEVIRFTNKGIPDRLTLLAIVKLIENIGEASVHISASLKEKTPEVPWHQMKGMRNYLVHEYYQVEVEEIESVVSEHIEPLLAQLNRLWNALP